MISAETERTGAGILLSVRTTVETPKQRLGRLTVQRNIVKDREKQNPASNKIQYSTAFVNFRKSCPPCNYKRLELATISSSYINEVTYTNDKLNEEMTKALLFLTTNALLRIEPMSSGVYGNMRGALGTFVGATNTGNKACSHSSSEEKGGCPVCGEETAKSQKCTDPIPG